jgi:hypothetical protein
MMRRGPASSRWRGGRTRSTALQRLGFYRLQQGRPAEVAAPVQLALRLNPLDAHWTAFGHFYLGKAQFHLRHDDKAYEEMREAVAANASNGSPGSGWPPSTRCRTAMRRARAYLAALQKIIARHTVNSLRAAETSKNADFRAERGRFYEGLRKAGLPP